MEDQAAIAFSLGFYNALGRGLDAVGGKVSIDEAYAAGETEFKKAGKKRGDPKQLGKAVNGTYEIRKGRAASRLDDQPFRPFRDRSSEGDKAEGEPLRPQRNRSTVEKAEGEPMPLRPQRNRSTRAEQQQAHSQGHSHGHSHGHLHGHSHAQAADAQARLPFTAHMLEKQRGMLQPKSVSFQTLPIHPTRGNSDRVPPQVHEHGAAYGGAAAAAGEPLRPVRIASNGKRHTSAHPPPPAHITRVGSIL